MLRLIAFHHDRMIDRQFVLADGVTYVLGRSNEADLTCDWDTHISRRHVSLKVTGEHVELTILPTASNRVFVEGSEAAEVRLSSGASFVIGDSRFELRHATQTDSPAQQPLQQLAIDRRQLQRVRYDDADKRIEVLTSLPAVIEESGVERDLHVRLANLLLAGIQHADAVAVVGIDDDSDRLLTLHLERRFDAEGALQPSSRMVRSAVQQQRTILHVWGESSGAGPEYTQHVGFNWAFCTPFSDVSAERAFYVTGRSPQEGSAANEQRLHADIKFTEFIAEIVGSLQRRRQLERLQTGLRQFFSPPVLEALGDDLDISMLEPRECEVTVLFCDLRGFSHRAEQEAGNLKGLLERVSLALELMTTQILRFGGVTGDFQGDAALGFWGWPLENREAPLNACRAALAIHEEFARARRDPANPLTGFETSVGIAHGRAVAGKIGTREQVKVTVFGPVVNLASRLEGMTRELHVPILIDEELDRRIRNEQPGFEGRVRRLLKVLPYGMDRVLTVSELVPPAGPHCALTDDHLQDFERGVDAFVGGDWQEAWRCLHSMPADDRAQDYLSMLITQHDRRPPPDWDGVVRMKKKGG